MSIDTYESALRQAAQWFRDYEKHYMRTGAIPEARTAAQRAIVCEQEWRKAAGLCEELEKTLTYMSRLAEPETVKEVTDHEIDRLIHSAVLEGRKQTAAGLRWLQKRLDTAESKVRKDRMREKIGDMRKRAREMLKSA